MGQTEAAECLRVFPDSSSAESALPDDVPDGTEEEEGNEVEGDRPEDEPAHRKLDDSQEEIYAAHVPSNGLSHDS